MEFNSSSPEQNAIDLSLEEKIAMGFALSMVFLVGVPGNCMVIWTIRSHIKKHSATIQLVLNLALADLLTVLIVPVIIYEITAECLPASLFWMPKTTTYLLLVFMYVSVFTITAISVLRLLAVLHIFTLQNLQRRGTTGRIIAALWAVALLSAGPAFTGSQMDRGCAEKFGLRHEAAYILGNLLGFDIPLIVMCVCYTLVVRRLKQMAFRTKRRGAVLLMRVLVAFILCWLPWNITNVLLICSYHTTGHTREALLKTVSDMKAFTTILAFVNSCINPILYAFTFQNFQIGFKMSNIAKLFEEMNNSFKEKSDKSAVDLAEQSTALNK
ncbi:chemerin-like receptor 2 [Hemiscyllium ocellatum]|uniref:chemerin-like receptor 2 n=1 Tax=Hemiscyllium ocellatum TaxID=170820 RepID=UPI002966CDFB|nr:chemerin-like receptor 2 [Hemiscyllium ocellatum]